MRRRAPSILFIAAGIGLLVALPRAQAPAPVPPPAAASQSVTFARDIEPIFAKSCWNCHSADAQLADLDLSTREAALRGGEHGAALVPGNAEQSRLYRMVAGLEPITMPMDGSQLTPAEIAAIKSWIESGAEWGAPSAAATAKPAGASSALAALENMEHHAGAAQRTGRSSCRCRRRRRSCRKPSSHIRSIGSSRRHAPRRSSWRRRAPTSARSSAARTST